MTGPYWEVEAKVSRSNYMKQPPVYYLRSDALMVEHKAVSMWMIEAWDERFATKDEKTMKQATIACFDLFWM